MHCCSVMFLLLISCECSALMRIKLALICWTWSPFVRVCVLGATGRCSYCVWNGAEAERSSLAMMMMMMMIKQLLHLIIRQSRAWMVPSEDATDVLQGQMPPLMPTQWPMTPSWSTDAVLTAHYWVMRNFWWLQTRWWPCASVVDTRL